jgi:hypothetical protein
VAASGIWLAGLAVGAAGCLAACGTSVPRREYTDTDQRLAAKIELRARDLPPDWRADPTPAKGGVPQDCYDAILKHLVITGEAADGFFEGPKNFSRSPNYASSYVIAFAAHGTAVSALIRLTKTPALRCLAGDLESLLPEGASVERVSVRSLRFPALGERSGATAMTIGFAKGSFVPRGYVDAVSVQRGRVVALLLFGNVGNPFDPAMERHLARAVAARMPSS